MNRITMGFSLCALVASAAFAADNPPAFEVASVKQAAPQTDGRIMVRMGGDPGRVDYANVALKAVLARAYNVKQHQITGPAWLDDRYDITAKVPEGVPADQVPLMLQALLAERFKMTIHKETKDQSVYALVVGKSGPKLTKSEPVKPGEEAPGPRTFSSSSAGAPPPPPPPGGSGPGPSGSFSGRVGTGQAPPRGAMMMSMSGGAGGNARMQANGITLARFSDMLSNMLDRPVIDMTELTGNYDIALDVSMEDMVGMRRMAVSHGPGPIAGGGGDSGPAPDAAPSASIFTAIQNLGLKLDPRKAPVEFVIVDRGDKVPTEN
jgi:uncharacterized protein (TIGR03435 family)